MSMDHDIPMVDMGETGKRIKELREQSGLSVREVQNFLGLEAPQSIYHWQSGKTLPSVDHLIALSKLFGVSVEEILILRGSECL